MYVASTYVRRVRSILYQGCCISRYNISDSLYWGIFLDISVEVQLAFVPPQHHIHALPVRVLGPHKGRRVLL